MYPKGVERNVQVIQQLPVIIPVANCLVVTSRRISKCGNLDGITFTPQIIEFEKKHFPLAEECQHMVLFKRYEFSGHTIRLNSNGTTSTAVITEGTMTSSGSCTRGSFTRNGILYDGFNEQVEVNFRKFF